MIAKIYKAIFRLDYPLSYRIVDRLGEYLEFITDKTNEKPFSESKGAINMTNHSISHYSKIKNDEFTMNLDLKSFNAVIEFNNGIEINKLSKCPLFNLANEIIEKLEEGAKFKYNRIGFRIFLIIENSGLTFINLRDYIWKLNKNFGDALNEGYPESTDISIVFEARSKDDEKIRLQLGPYQEKEAGKYFSLQNCIKEGFIYDIDIWQNQVKLPNLKLTNFIKNYQEIYGKIINHVYKQLEKVL